MQEFNESISVWVFFNNNLIQPRSFVWHNRHIKISKVNLVHTSKIGTEVFYHFSVSSEDNFYRLKFNIHNLHWYLEAVEEG